MLTQTGTAFAAVDGYVVRDQPGDVLFYDLPELKAALTNSLVFGESSEEAKLWKHFGDSKSTGKILALHDDINGFIDFDAVKGALVQSLIDGTSFSVDGYTESSNAVKATGLPDVLKRVTLQDGAVVYEDYNNGSSLPSFTLTATISPLIGEKIVNVTLNTQNDTDYKVTVDGTELEYSESKDQFVGVLQTAKSEDELKALTVVTLSDFEVISIE